MHTPANRRRWPANDMKERALASQRLVTYPPSISTAYKEPFSARSSQSDTMPFPRSSRSRPKSVRLRVLLYWGRGGLVVRLTVSHLGELASISGGAIRMWESCRTMPLADGDLQFLPPLHSGTAPNSPDFTLIGSQGLDVKSRPSQGKRGEGELCNLVGVSRRSQFGRGVTLIKTVHDKVSTFEINLRNDLHVLSYCRTLPSPRPCSVDTQHTLALCHPAHNHNARDYKRCRFVTPAPSLAVAAFEKYAAPPGWRIKRRMWNYFPSGATVAERLARSRPSEANQVQSPVGSLVYRKWESCRVMPLVGGFSRGYPVYPAPSFWCRSIFTSITLIGSQDLAFKSRPNLFTLIFHPSLPTLLDAFYSPMRVIWASTEQRRNERAGETGDPRESPLISDIVCQYFHMRKSGSDSARD
ncbi:hypothetical protein PR048_015186 [Dryococelus australis]|uniref:Uncharacterized protein n=1 Tax=Dryococelus australis TaxID=614101 RepID=A0ABQ9HH86_9NEOP|nr:hypothetical protein PR048_015186 [Dryococelus australis]